jgi:hypothetical protein
LSKSFMHIEVCLSSLAISNLVFKLLQFITI